MKTTRMLGKLSLLISALLIFGCKRDDTTHLKRIGRKITARIQTSAAQLKETVGYDWENSVLPVGLRMRVVNRLRWDKKLGKEEITIRVDRDVVHLDGIVSTIDAKRRALDLAQKTTGVAKVEDHLTMANAEK